MLWSNWGKRIQLVAFLLLGLAFAILHHFLGIRLSGKRVSDVAIPSQPQVNALSNAISQIVKFLLASTIGIAIAQYFWSATKSYHDWRKLDAPLAAANGNPFTISALPTWYRSPGLAFSALMMMSMIFIPIFVPGSIRVVTASGLTQPCTVNTPNISMAYLATTRAIQVAVSPGSIEPQEPPGGFRVTYRATTLTTALVNRIIVSGSSLPIPNPCGVTICAYEVRFTAPTLQCSSLVNATYDFSTKLPPFYKEDTWIPVLNGTAWEYNYGLTVATREGVIPHMNPPLALSCNASAAVYHVRVHHNNISSHIDILNITVGSRLIPDFPDPLTLALGGLVLAVSEAFNGNVIVDSQYDGFTGTPLGIGYSPLMQWVRINNSSVLSWSNLITALPELMQNISVSLLSGQFPSINQTYMATLQTECSMTHLVYEYNSFRLLGLYALAWTTAAVFFLLGFLFVRKNEREHSLDFSNVADQLHLQPYSQVALKELRL